MKKYIIIALLFLPVMSMAAPSVKKFGGVVPAAGGTVKPIAAAKVTPTKISGTSSGANVARVGSIRLKPSVTGPAISESTGSSGARFPIIPSLKVYNSAATPRPTAVINNNGGSSASIEEITDLQKRVTNIENVTNPTDGDPKMIITNVSNLVNDVDVLKDHDDTISTSDPSGNHESLPAGRAWIWVEE